MTGSDNDAPKTIADLLEIMAALRTPGTGCPWDLEQSFETIAPYTIEEAYEVADAIERQDMGALKEELGDLLLQVVYHAQMAREDGMFTFADVVDAISRKMIRRHPHVFGDEAVRSSVELKGLWERVKAEEKAEKRAQDDRAGDGGLLSEVPATLPGLTRAAKLQAKAATVGFDWPDAAPVFAKVREELAELEAELGKDDEHADIAGELGDTLFALVNLARHVKVDPDAALRAANAKFTRRFARLEALLAADGRKAEDYTLEDLDRLWDQAKAEE